MLGLYSKEIFAALAIILTLFSLADYMRSVFWLKAVTPHAFSWLIWGILNTVGFFAMYSDGAGLGAFIFVFSSTGCFVLSCYGFFTSKVKFDRLDYVLLSLGLFAILAWLLIDNAFYPIIIVSLADFIGLIPTWRKAWVKPWEENLLYFHLVCFRFIFAIIAIENYTLITLTYPAAIVLMTGAFVLSITFRRYYLHGRAIGKEVF